jgi:PilZ domain-containing protein
MENQPEPRVDVDLLVRVWGMNAEGRPFFQNASARDISKHGAKLSGIEHPLKPGDVIGAQLGDKKARFRVVWTVGGGDPQKIQAGVQILEGQQCPWEQELIQKQKDSASAAQAAPAGQNKRRFPRHRVHFPIELLPESSASQMRTTATDISGRGCYVETLLPLPLGTTLSITFWMESEKITTSGIVKACDGGVGMGIEFTGLDEPTQERLQSLIETMDPAASGESASAS